MRVLALDLGHKRIGLAVSDEAASIAFPSGHLDSKGRKQDVKAIVELIEERNIGAVVVGLPRHMDGRRGKEAEAAEAFAQALRAATGLEVDLLDERLTSVEAERLLRDQGSTPAARNEVGHGKKARSPGKRKRAKSQRGAVDSIAASILLRTYLELRANRTRSSDVNEEGIEE